MSRQHTQYMLSQGLNSQDTGRQGLPTHKDERCEISAHASLNCITKSIKQERRLCTVSTYLSPAGSRQHRVLLVVETRLSHLPAHHNLTRVRQALQRDIAVTRVRQALQRDIAVTRVRQALQRETRAEEQRAQT